MRNEREWQLADRFSSFLDAEVYPKRFQDWTPERIKDKARQGTHGDIIFRKGVASAYVDEKAYGTEWDGCLIELLQDVKTRDLGWFYTLTGCTHLICGYYKPGNLEEPAQVYKVLWPRLREKYMALCASEPSDDKPQHYVTVKGYGLTLFAKVKWWQIADCIELLWGTPYYVQNDEAKRAWESTARKAGAA